ncbi:MAG: hypothetical protein EZS28_005387 [Streblomastix strix]|uniref:Uncharacterized protein n=1 Tax=Streblomastix strix TaxID=222440 RepID=A0A5J4WVV6_9EUKA|nr:MAG: hypothetical protein EZS28_005387 [Streblomastix strix]
MGMIDIGGRQGGGGQLASLVTKIALDIERMSDNAYLKVSNALMAEWSKALVLARLELGEVMERYIEPERIITSIVAWSEATRFGGLYFVEEMLRAKADIILDKIVTVSELK